MANSLSKVSWSFESLDNIRPTINISAQDDTNQKNSLISPTGVVSKKETGDLTTLVKAVLNKDKLAISATMLLQAVS